MSQKYARSGGHWIQHVFGCHRWEERAYRAALLVRDGFRCAYCGWDLRYAGAEDITLDHLQRRETPDRQQPSNLIVACRGCNAKRGDRQYWRDFAGPKAALRIREITTRQVHLELGQAYLDGTLETERYLDDWSTWVRGPGEWWRWNLLDEPAPWVLVRAG